ncbi:MAG TPA: glycoside hydrolase family 31 protein [Dongiaceae bacterium]|nr:glycoside hydrolase family 31 protein [Dongiaceae bacterium]
MSRIVGLLVIVTLCATGATCTRAQGWQHVGNVQDVEKRNDGVVLKTGAAKIEITFFRPGIVRVRVGPSGTFPQNASWAVIQGAKSPVVMIKDSKEEVLIADNEAVVRVKKNPLLINFEDLQGNTTLADEPSLPMAWNGERVRVWKQMPLLENYYGLGDHPGTLNRRNRAFTLWNTDSYAFQESTDPIYKSIPFFIGLRQGTAYGVFFDNAYRTNFDFGLESPFYYTFGSEGGEINYYYFAGPDPKKIVQRFVDMVGHTPLPPYWSLGFQQSRYSYYPEARVYEVAKTFREKKIPLDALYLDIDYQQGYAPFTVNRAYFPHFEQMIGDLSKQGIHTVLITDLHIKHDPDNHGYFPYESGAKADAFVKKADGSLYVAPVWPGPAVFPDFTLSRVREWWGTLYKDFVGMGVSGFWNDMNEPAVFETPTKTMPLNNRHRLDDGTTLPHPAVHNVFGMQNVRATHDGLLKLRPNERPFVLTRAAYAGTQRYAATWTGDNISTWNHIRMSTPIMLNMGLSGYPLVGSDIGGFAGSPPADLLTRWLELGVFNPIYRDHTGKGSQNQEPWENTPDQEATRKQYIELRYRLLPYIYTAMEETSRTGTPLMRPIFLEYPQLTDFYTDERDFLFGRDLLVEPVVTEMIDAEELKFPTGTWYDFRSPAKFTEKEQVTTRPRLDEVPLFVRAGAIVPMQPVIQSTSETPVGSLELRIYPGDDCRGSLYQDDGHTLNYESGEFLRVTYSCAVSAETVTVSSKVETAGYTPWWSEVDAKIFGASSAPKEVRIGDQKVSDWQYDDAEKAVVIHIKDARKDWSAMVRY